MNTMDVEAQAAASSHSQTSKSSDGKLEVSRGCALWFVIRRRRSSRRLPPCIAAACALVAEQHSQ